MPRQPPSPGASPLPSPSGAARGELTATPGTGKPLRWWVRGAPDALLAALLADADAVLAGPQSQPRPRMGRKQFYRVGPPGQAALFVKLFHPPRGALHWPGRLRRAKAWREARIAAELERRGFSAVLPLAIGEERRTGLLRRSFAVTRELPQARDLRTRLWLEAPSAAERREWLTGFGELQRRLHDAGVDQDDTSPNNFLLELGESGLRWTLIDFERCRVGRPLGWPRRWRLLAKLARHELGVSRSERLRFLSAYLEAGRAAVQPGETRRTSPGGPSTEARGAGRRERRAAWQAIEGELAGIRRRAARHAARGAFRPGRHVTREGDAWIVRGRETAPLLHLALQPREARATWVLAHQLERLGLPALEPARLDREGVAWVAPTPTAEPTAPERMRRISLARRAFERFGSFAREPEWLLSGQRALLRDPRAFELRRELRAWPARHCCLFRG
jgi:hypothetical protein